MGYTEGCAGLDRLRKGVKMLPAQNWVFEHRRAWINRGCRVTDERLSKLTLQYKPEGLR